MIRIKFKSGGGQFLLSYFLERSRRRVAAPLNPLGREEVGYSEVTRNG